MSPASSVPDEYRQVADEISIIIGRCLPTTTPAGNAMWIAEEVVLALIGESWLIEPEPCMHGVGTESSNCSDSAIIGQRYCAQHARAH